MQRVLILCTGNSCRSQMAEALWQSLGEGRWQAFSAGSKPAGYVHPLAIKAMSERDVDLSNHESKSIELFQDQPFDLVVSVCDNARESCPTITGGKEFLHWPFDDPAHATGSEDEVFEVFRRVRDEIAAKIENYLTNVTTT